jgi:hypothetical protein
MPLLQQQIIGSRLSIVLVGHETLTGILRIISEFRGFCEDVGVNGNGMPSHKYALRRSVIVQSIKLMGSNLSKTYSFGIRSE